MARHFTECENVRDILLELFGSSEPGNTLVAATLHKSYRSRCEKTILERNEKDLSLLAPLPQPTQKPANTGKCASKPARGRGAREFDPKNPADRLLLARLKQQTGAQDMTLDEFIEMKNQEIRNQNNKILNGVAPRGGGKTRTAKMP